MTNGRPVQAEREVLREAARVLRHMATGRLARRASGDYALSEKAGGRVKLTVAREMVAAFEARGWIAVEADGRFALAAAGACWLHRGSGIASEAFRRQHGEVETLPGGLRIDHASAPLDFLKRHVNADGRAFLTPEQCAAADRLQQDFETAQLRPRLTRDPAQPLEKRTSRPDEREHLCIRALDAKRRCLAAFDAAGPGLGDLLFDVVCMARGLNEAERGFGWPQRSGKAILRLALDRVARHYGLVSGGRRPGRIEAWSSALEENAAA